MLSRLLHLAVLGIGAEAPERQHEHHQQHRGGNQRKEDPPRELRARAGRALLRQLLKLVGEIDRRPDLQRLGLAFGQVDARHQPLEELEDRIADDEDDPGEQPADCAQDAGQDVGHQFQRARRKS